MNLWQPTKFLRTAGLIVLLAAFLALSGAMPEAQAAIPQEGPGPGSSESLGANFTPLADDGGMWEVGAHSAGGSLASYAYGEASALYNTLRSCPGWNWQGRYLYNNYWSWSNDFRRTALGGSEPYYIDTTDLQFYVGHGYACGFIFDDVAHGGAYLTPNDCYRSWGDGDNDWLALTSCNVLEDSCLGPWANCMYGQHLILGFKSTAYAQPAYSSQGYWFAYYLCQSYSVQQAWYSAGNRAQKTRTLRVIGNELACFNDRPWTATMCADSYDWDAWYTQYSPPAQAAGLEAATPSYPTTLEEMPRFVTPPLSLAEAQSQYSSLGNVFGVPTGTRTQWTNQDGGLWTSNAQGHHLEMDPSGGLYGYYDLNNLWTAEQASAAYQPNAATISPQDARDIADQFLRQNGLMPGDASYAGVMGASITAMNTSTGTLQIEDETPLMWDVSYNRVLSYTLPSAAGKSPVTVQFPVVGPGAQLDVSVSGNANVLSSIRQDPILGTLGGWRRVMAPSALRPGAVDTAPVLPAETIYTLYGQLKGLVALNQPSYDHDAYEILGHTLAYWEEAASVSQDELVPVYYLNVRFTKQGQEVGVADVAVPANASYMRPYARIESAPTGVVTIGETVPVVATDASQTLAALGYDASLNFALGSGNPEDYLYDWYVDSAEPANLVGSGRAFNYTVAVDTDLRDGVASQVLLLKVTDTSTPSQLASVTSAILSVRPRLVLPVIVVR